jgi:hypothetical protein
MEQGVRNRRKLLAATDCGALKYAALFEPAYKRVSAINTMNSIGPTMRFQPRPISLLVFEFYAKFSGVQPLVLFSTARCFK